MQKTSMENPADQYRVPSKSRINPYTELVIDTHQDYNINTSTSQDRLFYSSENLYNQLRTMKKSPTTTTTARSTDNMLCYNTESDASTELQHDTAMFTASAIYAKPLPKCERKSILKKPRESGDGESEPSSSSDTHPCSSELSELSESPISYLETDLDLGGGALHYQSMGGTAAKRGPPTLPKPVLSMDNLNRFPGGTTGMTSPPLPAPPPVGGDTASLTSPHGSEAGGANYDTLTSSTPAKKVRNVTQV